LFARVSESADIVVIAGDLTDYGLPEEAAVLAKEFTALRIPAAAVLGNHDLESGKPATKRKFTVRPTSFPSYNAFAALSRISKPPCTTFLETRTRWPFVGRQT
jgi:3',5'-cyclic AMP phosphodiesterase CpdA